jgi:hypothetical protein
MIIYYIILIFVLYFIIKYNNPSTENKNICIYICFAVILLFMLIKLKKYYIHNKYHVNIKSVNNIQEHHIKHEEESNIKHEEESNIKHEEESNIIRLNIPSVNTNLINNEEIPIVNTNTVHNEEIHNGEIHMKNTNVVHNEEIQMNNTNVLNNDIIQHKMCKKMMPDMKYKIPQPYRLTSENEDYILSGGLKYDNNNPKYPLLDKNQDIASFPESFGEIENIIDKYRHNDGNRYYDIYGNMPKNMSYSDVDSMMKLDKIRSLIQQSPLV